MKDLIPGMTAACHRGNESGNYLYLSKFVHVQISAFWRFKFDELSVDEQYR